MYRGIYLKEMQKTKPRPFGRGFHIQQESL